ncbi:MAG: hypothetical protein AAFX05_12325 [Planctomycetota bacterium]
MRRDVTRTWLYRFGLCIVGLAALAVASPASAQMNGLQKMLDPAVTGSQIERLAEMIDADDTQTAVLEDLLSSYQGEHAEAAQRLRDIIRSAQEEAQSSGDISVMIDIQRKALEFYEYRAKLRDSFFDDLKLTLSDEQAEQWPRFERLNRRYNLLDEGNNVVSGASVDLVELVYDELGGAKPSEAMRAEMDRYEVELDQLLRERWKLNQESIEQVMEAFDSGADMTALQTMQMELFDKGRESQVKVRDINDRYARKLALLLEGEEAEEMTDEFNRRSMPQVYASSYAEDGFRTALDISDLTPEQVDQIEGLQSEYDREADMVRAKWAEALKAWQSDAGLMDMLMNSGGGKEVREQADAKKELDERFYTRLRETLTEDQRSRLPERETAPNWRDEPAFGR